LKSSEAIPLDAISENRTNGETFDQQAIAYCLFFSGLGLSNKLCQNVVSASVLLDLRIGWTPKSTYGSPSQALNLSISNPLPPSDVDHLLCHSPVDHEVLPGDEAAVGRSEKDGQGSNRMAIPPGFSPV
jgi:hypothetical protein